MGEKRLVMGHGQSTLQQPLLFSQDLPSSLLLRLHKAGPVVDCPSLSKLEWLCFRSLELFLHWFLLQPFPFLWYIYSSPSIFSLLISLTFLCWHLRYGILYWVRNGRSGSLRSLLMGKFISSSACCGKYWLCFVILFGSFHIFCGDDCDSRTYILVFALLWRVGGT